MEEEEEEGREGGRAFSCWVALCLGNHFSSNSITKGERGGGKGKGVS